MRLVPVTISDARAFVAEYHRHNKPPLGGLFAIGLADADELIGVAVVGRPVARMLQNGTTAEVTRVCIKEPAPKNANSMLYGACWRAWRAMGGERLVTYTLASESGASLRASGWRDVGRLHRTSGWSCPSREREALPLTDGVDKVRWERAT